MVPIIAARHLIFLNEWISLEKNKTRASSSAGNCCWPNENHRIHFCFTAVDLLWSSLTSSIFANNLSGCQRRPRCPVQRQRREVCNGWCRDFLKSPKDKGTHLGLHHRPCGLEPLFVVRLLVLHPDSVLQFIPYDVLNVALVREDQSCGHNLENEDDGDQDEVLQFKLYGLEAG